MLRGWHKRPRSQDATGARPNPEQCRDGYAAPLSRKQLRAWSEDGRRRLKPAPCNSFSNSLFETGCERPKEMPGNAPGRAKVSHPRNREGYSEATEQWIRP